MEIPITQLQVVCFLKEAGYYQIYLEKKVNMYF